MWRMGLVYFVTVAYWAVSRVALALQVFIFIAIGYQNNMIDNIKAIVSAHIFNLLGSLMWYCLHLHISTVKTSCRKVTWTWCLVCPPKGERGSELENNNNTKYTCICFCALMDIFVCTNYLHRSLERTEWKIACNWGCPQLLGVI